MVEALMNHPIVKALDIAKNGEIDLDIIKDEMKANEKQKEWHKNYQN